MCLLHHNLLWSSSAVTLTLGSLYPPLTHTTAYYIAEDVDIIIMWTASRPIAYAQAMLKL